MPKHVEKLNLGDHTLDVEIKDLIRTKRRRYLHIYSQDHANLAPDAVQVFKATVTVVTKIIGQDVHDRKIILNPAVVKYLERDDMPEAA